MGESAPENIKAQKENIKFANIVALLSWPVGALLGCALYMSQLPDKSGAGLMAGLGFIFVVVFIGVPASIFLIWSLPRIWEELEPSEKLFAVISLIPAPLLFLVVAGMWVFESLYATFH